MLKKIRLFRKKELPLHDLKPKGTIQVGTRLSFNEMGAKQYPSSKPFKFN